MMISCADAVRQMWEYVEQELDGRERATMDEHLARCRQCCGEMEFAEQLGEFMARRPPGDIPPAVASQFDNLLERLETEGAG